jgi:hypothetical protein
MAHVESEKKKAFEDGKNWMAQECYKEVRALGNNCYPLKDLYEKEIKEKILREFEKVFNKFGRKNIDKMKTSDFGYYLPELDDDDVVTDLKEIIKIINKI